MLSFLRAIIDVLSERGKLVAISNMAFFCSIFIVVLVAQFLFPRPVYLDEPLTESWIIFGNESYTIFLGIFASNLVLSAFVVVTLSGALFFPLSFIFLIYKAASWGLLVYQMPSWLFLIGLPVLVFEGEAYVIAAVAGTLLGISWLRPHALYHNGLTRKGSLKMILKECFALYWIVIGLLLLAASIETAIIMLSQTFT